MAQTISGELQWHGPGSGYGQNHNPPMWLSYKVTLGSQKSDGSYDVDFEISLLKTNRDKHDYYFEFPIRIYLEKPRLGSATSYESTSILYKPADVGKWASGAYKGSGRINVKPTGTTYSPELYISTAYKDSDSGGFYNGGCGCADGPYFDSNGNFIKVYDETSANDQWIYAQRGFVLGAFTLKKSGSPPVPVIQFQTASGTSEQYSSKYPDAKDQFVTMYKGTCVVVGKSNISDKTLIKYRTRDLAGNWSDWSSESKFTSPFSMSLPTNKSGIRFAARNYDDSYETATSGYPAQYETANGSTNYIQSSVKLRPPTTTFSNSSSGTFGSKVDRLSVGKSLYIKVAHTDNISGSQAVHYFKGYGNDKATTNDQIYTYTTKSGQFDLQVKSATKRSKFVTSDYNDYQTAVGHIYHAPQLSQVNDWSFSYKGASGNWRTDRHKSITLNPWNTNCHWGVFNCYKLKYIVNNQVDYETNFIDFDSSKSHDIKIDTINLLLQGNLKCPGQLYKICIVGGYKDKSKGIIYDGSQHVSEINNYVYIEDEFLLGQAPDVPSVLVPYKEELFSAYFTINPRPRIVVECCSLEESPDSYIKEVVLHYEDFEREYKEDWITRTDKSLVERKSGTLTALLNYDKNSSQYKLLSTSSPEFIKVSTLTKSNNRKSAVLCCALPEEESFTLSHSDILRCYSITCKNDLGIESEAVSTPTYSESYSNGTNKTYWTQKSNHLCQPIVYDPLVRHGRGDEIAAGYFGKLGGLLGHAMLAYQHYVGLEELTNNSKILRHKGSSNKFDNYSGQEAQNRLVDSEATTEIPRQIPQIWLQTICEYYDRIKEYSPMLDKSRLIEMKYVRGLDDGELIYANNHGESDYYQGNIFSLVYDGLKYML